MITLGVETQTSYATIRLIDDHIVENVIHDHAKLDVEEVCELKAINQEHAFGKPYCVLVNPGMFSSVTKAAREETASKAFVQNTVAKALLTHSLGHKIICGFYLKVNRPHIKTKVFKDREKAIHWLRLQLK